MARTVHIYSIERVAKTIGENLELLEIITWDSDSIDYGEMAHVVDGTEDGITTFTERGVECLQELLADIRTGHGGIRKYLGDEQCDPEVAKRIMADETQYSQEE